MRNKSEEIKLKVEKAQAFLREVDILIQDKFYSNAINRLYYSCFHITSFLLLNDLTPKTHKGTATILQKEFVQKGLFDVQHASLFAKLMNERNESDYGDFLIIDEKDIDIFFEPSKNYIEYVSGLIMEQSEDL